MATYIQVNGEWYEVFSSTSVGEDTVLHVMQCPVSPYPESAKPAKVIKRHCLECEVEFVLGPNQGGKLYCDEHRYVKAYETNQGKCVICGLPIAKWGKKYCIQHK